MNQEKSYVTATVGKKYMSGTIRLSDLDKQREHFEAVRLPNEESAIMQVSYGRGESSEITISFQSRGHA